MDKSILKNTSFLFFRMLIVIVVNLMTVRILFNSFGEVKYGVFELISGFVVLLGFFTNTLSTSTQRFISNRIGKKDDLGVQKIFSNALLLFICFALFFSLISIPMGLYLIDYKFDIPDNIESNSKIAYLLSVFNFIVILQSVPFNALIISFEKFKFFAFLSLVEAGLKIIVIFVITLNKKYEELVLYPILLTLVNLSILIYYIIYCKKNLFQVAIRLSYSKSTLKKLLSFSGWNIVGALAAVLNKQGINILINVFFGPVMNATNAISIRVSTTLNQFVMNFMTAAKPRVFKSYASGDIKGVNNLIFSASKLSLFLLLLIVIPVLVNVDFLIKLWLGKLPIKLIEFVQLAIVNIIINSVSFILMISAQATGKIKVYQLTVGSIMLSIIPLTYVGYFFGIKSEDYLVISIFVNLAALYARVAILQKYLGNQFKNNYFYNFLRYQIPIILFSYLFYFCLNNLKQISNLYLSIIAWLIFYIPLVYIFGLKPSEKKELMSYVLDKIKNKK